MILLGIFFSVNILQFSRVCGLVLFGFVLWHINYCGLFNANPIYTYLYQIYMIWFGWLLWHINPCGLFNAKSYLYIYIKYRVFGLVEFYGISTIVGYLIPNPLYTISVSQIFSLTVKWFQVLLCITKTSIKHQSFIYTVKW